MAGIDYLAKTDTVHVATELRAGGEVVTPIWSVVVDGIGYIRSGYGADSKWYQRAQRTGKAAFVDGTTRYPATIKNVTDEAANASVDAAYRAKYAAQREALNSMVAPQARAHTMRVDLTS